MDINNCVLSVDIVLVVMEIIQLTNNDGAHDLISLCGYNDVIRQLRVGGESIVTMIKKLCPFLNLITNHSMMITIIQ
jgi:hypothetical protein